MLFAPTREFLAHPTKDKEKHPLIDHLVHVGNTSKELFCKSKFDSYDLPFYAGLLHDIGKINPFYQEIFHLAEENEREEAKNTLLKKYVQEHARFSAWAAQKLLDSTGIDDDVIDKIMVLIYGHHSTIRKSLGKFSQDARFKESQKMINERIPEFCSQTAQIPEFSKLDWEACVRRFPRPINFDVELESTNSVKGYLEMSFAFSCLLQADRGSFKKWSVPNFDLKINTESLKKESPLEKFRSDFQKQAAAKFDSNEPISIINAPTGIGKTKVFLEIMNEYSKEANVERVFYFSPLLALTESFESKIAPRKDKTNRSQPIVAENDLKDILMYTHLFSGSLEDRNKSGKSGQYSDPWIFENESFNKKFIITTTQRLLMTIYSNSAGDKIKMASFKNSVLIIDEVQTIPKPILSNLKEIFKKMNEYMNTRFILISATIPHEIAEIKRIELSKDTLSGYLKQTQKEIAVKAIEIERIPIEKTLVMANTRRKAADMYSKISKVFPDKKIIYMSTGIKKIDRLNIIEKLPEMSEYVLVSTQVVEAGVDISFSHIFREQAPLDNIIQVMGRLNREGDSQNSKLTIYQTDDNPIPYSPLEFNVTKKMISNITNSVQIYDILEKYYSEISARNKKNVKDTEKLEECMKSMDFDEVWKFVKNMVFREDSRDTVFVPNEDDLEEVKEYLLNGKARDIFKKFGNYAASLPVSPYKIGIELFDEELKDKNILLPKKQYLHDVYDERIGLDKWLLS